MKTVSSFVRPSAIVVVILGLLVGCTREQPVYDVRDRAVPTNLAFLGLVEIEKRIINAAAATQWQAKPIKPGLVRATNRRRNHVAVVKIEFNTRTYSIKYESSKNLLYGEGYVHSSGSIPAVIHRNYNKRVRQLEFEIVRQLSRPAS